VRLGNKPFPPEQVEQGQRRALIFEPLGAFDPVEALDLLKDSGFK
jgi:hypothetical protein